MEKFDVLDEKGKPTGQVESREKCHNEGLWHRAIFLFILSKDNKKVLLQQRSASKKLWPNLWDPTAGGHVLSGESIDEAIIRETKEELGIDIDESELEYIEELPSINIQGPITNKHFNNMYVVHKDVNLDDIVLQKEEVQDVKWFDVEEVKRRVNNNYDGITDKDNAWFGLEKYLENQEHM